MITSFISISILDESGYNFERYLIIIIFTSAGIGIGLFKSLTIRVTAQRDLCLVKIEKHLDTLTYILELKNTDEKEQVQQSLIQQPIVPPQSFNNSNNDTKNQYILSKR